MKKTFFLLLILLPLISHGQVKTGLDTTKVKPNNKQSQKNNTPDQQPDRLPDFPGGEKKLFKFIADNLEYPVNARNDKVQGTVILRFVVTEIGKIDSIVVLRGVRPDLNNEAIELVKKMPNWIPGIENGKPTRIRFTLPLTFRYQ